MIILFISTNSPYDKESRSGVPYSIFNELSKKNQVIWIEPKIKGVYRVPYIIQQLCFFILRKIGFKFSARTLLTGKLYSIDVQRKIDKIKDYNAIFSLGTTEISYIRTEKPIFIRIDAIHHSFPNYYSFGLAKQSIKWANNLEEKALNKITCLFSPSQWVIDEIEKFIPQHKFKIHLVETGANLNPKSIKYESRQYGVNIPLKMIFIGFDIKRKGIDIAYEIVELLNEKYKIQTTLSIIGGKPEDSILNSPYIQYIGLLNKNIECEYKKFYEEFSKSNLFIFPTKAECHGIVNCEAAAYALPIFSFDTGGVSSYVKNDVNGYAMPINSTADDFAKKIVECVENGQLSKFSINSRLMYEEKFNWNVWGEKVLVIMRKILDNV